MRETGREREREPRRRREREMKTGIKGKTGRKPGEGRGREQLGERARDEDSQVLEGGGQVVRRREPGRESIVIGCIHTTSAG